jgi:hypothetical protein
LYLSPRYTEKQWKDAFVGSEDWQTAINIVEDRIKGRWLDAADILLESPNTGFAIIAIDCIVLESLWGFINGKSVPSRQEQQVYKEILSGQNFRWKEDQCESFRQFVRNGIMHDAETRNGWLLVKADPDSVVPAGKAGEYRLNRTKFHNALKGTFEDWIEKLRGGDQELRRNMRKRMNQIIAKHYGKK